VNGAGTPPLDALIWGFSLAVRGSPGGNVPPLIVVGTSRALVDERTVGDARPGPDGRDAVPLDLDELVEHWTLPDDDQELVAGKRGVTRLGFALLLKFYTRKGRFPPRPQRAARRGDRLRRPPGQGPARRAGPVRVDRPHDRVPPCGSAGISGFGP
jgi:hypothetical protein